MALNPQNIEKHKWKPGQSGNPKGKPKGTISLSAHIRNLMSDKDFQANILDPKVGIKEYTGVPVKAIINVAIAKAVSGEDKSREWLAKYGWGLPKTDEPDELTVKFEVINRVPEPKE